MNRYRILPILFMISMIATAPAVLGQALPEQGDSRKGPGPTLWTHDSRYQLQIGDVLEVIFRFTPEFNQTVTIQPDGFINLRDLPDVKAAGKSTPELTLSLQKAYSQILHDPIVTLQLKDFEKPYFIADGELEKPGKYELRGETTVIQAIAIAGGFRKSAKHSQVMIFHRLSDLWTERRLIDVKNMLRSGDLREDPGLRPGDLIFVPKNSVSKFERFIPTWSIGGYFPR